MQKERLHALPLLLLMAILLLPVTLLLAGVPTAPLNEYRVPTAGPTLQAYFGDGKQDFVGFTAHLEAWFSDRIPTRTVMIQLYTQLLYSLFNESSQLHIGTEGWLYYRSVIDVQTPRLERLSDDYLTGMTERLAQLSALLEAQGVLLYVMPVALKHRYYPEYLPASARHARHAGFFDRYLDGLISNGRIRVLDSRPLLEDARDSGLSIFHHTDFHWTDPAGALVFRALLEDMAQTEDKLDLLASWHYETVPSPDYSGGQARALPLFRPLSETSVDVQFNGPMAEFRFGSNDGFAWSGVVIPPAPQNLQPILIYGDSFGDSGLRAGIHHLFQSFALARSPVDDLVQAYRNRQPGTRYFLIEFIPSSTTYIDDQVRTLIEALSPASDP